VIEALTHEDPYQRKKPSDIMEMPYFNDVPAMYKDESFYSRGNALNSEEGGDLGLLKEKGGMSDEEREKAEKQQFYEYMFGGGGGEG
jgi:hypothetical protein